MKQASIYAFASGKGGVGKTLLTAAFGITLSRKGKRVLLIDGDMGMRNMDLLLGVQDECFYHILDLAEGRCFARDVILPVADNLDFLPAASGVTWEHVFPAAMDTVLEDVGDRYDFILFDCPAGRGEGISFAAKVSTKLFIVMAPSYASRRNAEELMAHRPLGKDVRYILNQFSFARKDWISFDAMMENMDTDLFLGVVPYSEEADRLSHEGRILDFTERGAFGKAVASAVKAAVEEADYPLSRWESLIRMADAENQKEMAGSHGPVKPHLTWHSASPRYKWQRRR